MVLRCSIVGCDSKWVREKEKIGLFRVPMVIKNQCSKTEELSTRRRRLWLARINWVDQFQQPDNSIKVCSKHFIKGRPARLFEESDPDWLPNLNLPNQIQTPSSANDSQVSSDGTITARENSPSDEPGGYECDHTLKRKWEEDPGEEESKMFSFSTNCTIDFHENSGRLPSLRDGAAVYSICDIDPSADPKSKIPLIAKSVSSGNSKAQPIVNSSVAVQTDMRASQIKGVYSRVRNLQSQVVNLQTENKTLSEKLACFERQNFSSRLDSHFDQESFKGNDFKVNFYTGLPTYARLMHVFKLLETTTPDSHPNALPKFSELLLTMMRLRLGLSEQDLAFRFNISLSTVGIIFEKWIHMMSTRLSMLIQWPERHVIQATMPHSFQATLGNKVAVIIDHFEISVEVSSPIVPETEPESTSKDHETVKFLIGITPQGTVSFISRDLGETPSEKSITLNSRFLGILLPGDVVMAGKSSTVSTEVGKCHTQLSIPSLTKGDPKLPSEDLLSTSDAEIVKLHVDRLVGMLKNKFTIFNQVLPASCLEGHVEDDNALVDHMVRVCCALINLCPPLEEKSFM